jgi:hypothetical protein
LLDPDGIATCKRHRLRRRLYFNPGPNFLWHIDGYDKLKPYGICISGAIDGFSRYVVWMHAHSTNNDPSLIASYFMTEIKARKACPSRIRADRGTENGHVEQMMVFLREDHDAYAQKCFLYGSSNHNQRIESWWAFLRKHHAQFWMNTFRHLKETGSFDGGYLDKNLVRFCCMYVIQVCMWAYGAGPRPPKWGGGPVREQSIAIF